jgi:hypothetical protein
MWSAATIRRFYSADKSAHSIRRRANQNRGGL